MGTRASPPAHLKKSGLKARFLAAPEKQWNLRAKRPQNIFYRAGEDARVPMSAAGENPCNVIQLRFLGLFDKDGTFNPCQITVLQGATSAPHRLTC